MLTKDELARLRDACDVCVTGTFVHKHELTALLRIAEAVAEAPEATLSEGVHGDSTLEVDGITEAQEGEFRGAVVRLVRVEG